MFSIYHKINRSGGLSCQFCLHSLFGGDVSEAPAVENVFVSNLIQVRYSAEYHCDWFTWTIYVAEESSIADITKTMGDIRKPTHLRRRQTRRFDSAKTKRTLGNRSVLVSSANVWNNLPLLILDKKVTLQSSNQILRHTTSETRLIYIFASYYIDMNMYIRLSTLL